jgi:agmatine deiminase
MTMPAEWQPHAGTIMGYPHTTYDGEVSLDVARAAWGAVAQAIQRFEPVTMVVHPDDRAVFDRDLGSSVQGIEVPLDDAWLRDTGPTFVVREGKLHAVDWTFNGWGAQDWADWQHDAELARFLSSHFGAPASSSTLVNEGGGIEVDGAGLLVVTETVQLDPHRNGSWTKRQVEVELMAQLGVDEPIWIPRGLAGDYGPFATRGHVDLVVKFIAAGVALVHRQTNPNHPDYELFGEVSRLLEARGVEVIPLNGPTRIDLNGSLCDWSYVNCYPTNGGLIVGTFNDDADDAAMATLAETFPGRELAPVDASVLFSLGGGVHCITQQIPSVKES